jgi:hypothetical protein
MDLNIGTAFWFAARGEGYLRDYTLEEMEQAYDTSSAEDRGPLLRLGEEDAMKSVGLSVVDEESREKFYQKQKKSTESAACAHEGPLPCDVPLCKRIGKAGCIRNKCKRCCDRAYREEQLLIDPDVTKVFLNNCPAHKVSEKRMSNLKEKANKRDIFKKNKKQQTQEMGEEKDVDVDRIEDDGDAIERVMEKVDDSVLEAAVESFCIDSLQMEDKPSISTTESVFQEETRIPYKSKCKVLLVGLGADEQLAGYGRHRTCFAQNGWQGLCDELNMDLERLWTRNLGRYVFKFIQFML